MARVGADLHAAAVTRQHAGKMGLTGKALKGFIYVSAEETESGTDLETWAELALSFIESLPPC